MIQNTTFKQAARASPPKGNSKHKKGKTKPQPLPPLPSPQGKVPGEVRGGKGGQGARGSRLLAPLFCLPFISAECSNT